MSHCIGMYSDVFKRKKKERMNWVQCICFNGGKRTLGHKAEDFESSTVFGIKYKANESKLLALAALRSSSGDVCRLW